MIMKDFKKKKTESYFEKRVITHKGCWHHSWQDHNPSIMKKNQIKWQDITSPPWFCFLNDYDGPKAINLNLVLSKESTHMNDAGTTVDKTTIPV
jgi:hypothetical protein